MSETELPSWAYAVSGLATAVRRLTEDPGPAWVIHLTDQEETGRRIIDELAKHGLLEGRTHIRLSQEKVLQALWESGHPVLEKVSETGDYLVVAETRRLRLDRDEALREVVDYHIEQAEEMENPVRRGAEVTPEMHRAALYRMNDAFETAMIRGARVPSARALALDEGVDYLVRRGVSRRGAREWRRERLEQFFGSSANPSANPRDECIETLQLIHEHADDVVQRIDEGIDIPYEAWWDLMKMPPRWAEGALERGVTGECAETLRLIRDIFQESWEQIEAGRDVSLRDIMKDGRSAVARMLRKLGETPRRADISVWFEGGGNPLTRDEAEDVAIRVRNARQAEQFHRDHRDIWRAQYELGRGDAYGAPTAPMTSATRTASSGRGTSC